MKHLRHAIRCGSMADLITLSPLTAEITVHAVVGLDPEGRMYLLDLWRKQAAADDWIESFCDLVLRWKPIGWAEEQGQIRSGVGPFLDRRRGSASLCFRDQFPTRGDKAIRAQSFAAGWRLKGLYVPINAPWYPDLRANFIFPAGKHDDQVDALGLVGQLLDKMMSGRRPVVVSPKRKLDWFEQAEDDGRSNWKTA
jgi:predicted phage terminase large subunit-like protein